MSLAEPWETDIDCWYEPVLLDNGFGLRICPDAFAWIVACLSPGGRYKHAQREVGHLFARPAAGKPWGSSYATRSFEDADGWTICSFASNDYRANAIAGAETLDLLVSILQQYEGPRVAGRTQLLTLDRIGKSDQMGGGSIAASMSPKLAAWIASHGRSHHFPEISVAISRNAYSDTESVRLHGLGADAFVLRSGKMTFEIGGNVSLGPSDPNDWNGGGWSTHANNMDHPFTPFGILCGLGCLHRLARNAGL